MSTRANEKMRGFKFIGITGSWASIKLLHIIISLNMGSLAPCLVEGDHVYL